MSQLPQSTKRAHEEDTSEAPPDNPPRRQRTLSPVSKPAPASILPAKLAPTPAAPASASASGPSITTLISSIRTDLDALHTTTTPLVANANPTSRSPRDVDTLIGEVQDQIALLCQEKIQENLRKFMEEVVKIGQSREGEWVEEQKKWLEQNEYLRVVIAEMGRVGAVRSGDAEMKEQFEQCKAWLRRIRECKDRWDVPGVKKVVDEFQGVEWLVAREQQGQGHGHGRE